MAQGKEHQVTPETKQQVERLKACGLSHSQIGYILGGLTDKTVEKHYKEELQHGKAKVDAFVTGKLLKKIQAEDTACIIFYLKTRMNWRETDRLELTGAEGEAIKILVDRPPAETRLEWEKRVLGQIGLN